MTIPFTRQDHLQRIAVETAKMSYPGSMSRGIRPVVSGGTKAALQIYFEFAFPMANVWDTARTIALDYDTWHSARVDEIAHHIGPKVSAHNVPESVAAKFLNTFMHQLMKYEEARPLFACLHLPLDARVFSQLLRIRSPSLAPLRTTFECSPYSLPYNEHGVIQDALTRYLAELNARPGAGFRLNSRIELNWLWL
jgi:hypothetical protein